MRKLVGEVLFMVDDPSSDDGFVQEFLVAKLPISSIIVIVPLLRLGSTSAELSSMDGEVDFGLWHGMMMAAAYGR